MRRVVITHAFRTPIGRFLGQFRNLSAVELGAEVVRGLLDRSGVDGREVDELVFGCARQAGTGPNPGRQVALSAGLPATLPAQTINMACASGLMAIIQAARVVATGEAECVVAGGAESMSQVPFLLPGFRTGLRMGHQAVADAMYRDGFDCPLAGQVMGETAETLARQYAIGREEQDAYACRSQQRAAAARLRFAEEIIPVPIADRQGRVQTVGSDEHPRPATTMADLAALPAVFDREQGTVTAGNSSGITDGAAALLVMSAESARGRGFDPLATVEGWQAAGVDPRVMGLGPVPAVRRLLERQRRTLDAYDLVELNEAFASQVIACDRELGFDPEKLNVNGGAIALGHPIGATGGRITVTLLHEMRRRKVVLGLAALCVSGGQGVAVSLRRGE